MAEEVKVFAKGSSLSSPTSLTWWGEEPSPASYSVIFTRTQHTRTATHSHMLIHICTHTLSHTYAHTCTHTYIHSK